MTHPKRKRQTSLPPHAAPTKGSKAKRVRFSLPLQQGPQTPQPGSPIHRSPTVPKGILQTKRPREHDDDDEVGSKPKRRLILLCRPRVSPAEAPNEVTGEELTKESVKEEKDEDGTSVEVDCAAERCKGCK